MRRVQPALGKADGAERTPPLSPMATANASRPQRVTKFLGRNQWSDKCELRRKCAQAQRDIHEVGQKQEDSLSVSWGAQGVEGFRKLLRSRFGSISAAWRLRLDREGNGQVSWGELCKCCREIGYNGNLKKLWAELDLNKSGFISLSELDAKASKCLAEFRRLCLDQFGSTIAAWNHGINPEGAPGVGLQTFAERCTALGYQGNAGKLFKWLLTDPQRTQLTLRDIDPATAAALLRADPCSESLSFGGGRRAVCSLSPKAAPMSPLSGTPLGVDRRKCMLSSLEPLAVGAAVTEETAESPSLRQPAAHGQPPAEPDASDVASPFGHQQMGSMDSSCDRRSVLGASRSSFGGCMSRTITSEWRHELSQTQISGLRDKRSEHVHADCGMWSLEDLRAGLAAQFGSVFRGWERAIDPHRTGKISFSEFCSRLRALGYKGDVRDLWARLGAGEEHAGFVCLRDLDPKADKLLGDFRGKLREKYGNMLSAWTCGFDARGTGTIDEATFVNQCGEVGIEDDAASTLFHMLKEDHARKLMTLQDFDRAAHAAQTRGDHEMITEDAERKQPLHMSFDERQDNTFSVKWSRTHTMVSRSLHQSLMSEMHSMDKGCDSLESLKALLVRRYGTLAAAWRIGLDPLNAGKLSREDFVKAVRQRVGYNGDYKDLWAQLAQPGASGVTLHDLDPAAAEALWSFREWLLRHYGDIVTAWRQGLDPRSRGRLEEEEFAARCAALEYNGDTRQLWVLLRAEPHRRYITISDLDMTATQAYYRGDDEAITVKGARSGPHESPRAWPSRASKALPGQPTPAQLQQHGPARHTGVTRWQNHLGKSFRGLIEHRGREERGRQMGIDSLAGFRRSLVSRFGSSVAAWRAVLDPNGTGWLSSGQFRDALERLGGFAGSVKQLWIEFDVKCTGRVTLEDLDAEAHKMLADLGGALVERCGSLLGAWGALSDAGVDFLSEAAFLERCAELDLGWEPKRLQRAYRLLLPEHGSGRKSLVVGDLGALLLALPTRDRHVAWRGSYSPPASPGRAEEVSQSSLRLRDELGLDCSVDAFRKTLARTFGSLWAGWVRYLDVTQAGRVPLGRVPMGEFVQRAKAIGATGNVKALFTAFDSGGKGFITFHDLNPEVAEAIESFLQLAEQTCGSIGEAWHRAMDMGRSGRVCEDEFVQGCQLIGYQGDAAKLFSFFRPEVGRHFLVLEDLGPRAVDWARAQAASPTARQPKAPGSPSPPASPSSSPKLGPARRQAEASDRGRAVAAPRPQPKCPGRPPSSEGWDCSASASSESTRVPEGCSPMCRPYTPEDATLWGELSQAQALGASA